MVEIAEPQIRSTARRFRWQDGLFGLGAAAVDLAAFWAPSKTSSVIATAALAGVGGIALGWRRASPIGIFIICLVESVTAGILLGGYRPTVVPLVALYTVCAYENRRFIPLFTLAAMVMASAFWVAREGNAADTDSALTVMFVTAMVYTLVYVAVFTAGQWRRAQIRYVLESSRREQVEAASAVAAERARITKDLHDTVAHNVTVIILLAAVARMAQLSDPNKVTLNLERIEQAGRDAMNDLRDLFMLMRSEEPDDAEVQSHSLGLNDLPELVTRMSLAGLTITLVEGGQRGFVDQATELTAYLAVQEGLINIAKHAGMNSPVRVCIEWGNNLVVEINNGPADGSTPLRGMSTGLGLTHLRGRVEAAGGSLVATKTEDGGFTVRAELPARQCSSSIAYLSVPIIAESEDQARR